MLRKGKIRLVLYEGPQLHMLGAKREDNKDMYLYDIQLSFDILPRSLLQYWHWTICLGHF